MHCKRENISPAYNTGEVVFFHAESSTVAFSVVLHTVTAAAYLAESPFTSSHGCLFF